MIRYLVQSLVVVAITYNGATAQNGFSGLGDIGEVKTRKLIVMIERPNATLMRKMERKPSWGSVADYKADLEEFNHNLSAVVEKFWPYNKRDIQYKTFDEIMELSQHSKEYVVIACVSAKENRGQVHNTFFKGLHWKKDIRNDFEQRGDLMCSMLVVNVVEGFNLEPTFYTPLFDVFPTKASIVCGIRSMEQYFASRFAIDSGVKKKEERRNIANEMDRRAPSIVQKTLLIRSEWLDLELNSGNLKNYYPYNYEVCDRPKMDEVIMASDSNYVCGVVTRFIQYRPALITTSPLANTQQVALYSHYILDASDGHTLARVEPDAGQSLTSTLTGKAGHRNFTIKVISKLVEQINGNQGH